MDECRLNILTSAVCFHQKSNFYNTNDLNAACSMQMLRTQMLPPNYVVINQVYDQRIKRDVILCTSLTSSGKKLHVCLKGARLL